MLHSISWSAYFITLGLCLILYYACWLRRYYSALPFSKPGPESPQKESELPPAAPAEPPNPTPLILLLAIAASTTANAQDGNTGINQANTMVRSYFDTGVPLMYAVGAILGLIGAVKVYQKWSHGDHDTGKVAASWFGACIFLVVVATLIRSFFGL